MTARSGRDRRPSDSGAVLVAVVLIMLATLGLAHGLLLAARSELRVSRAGARRLEARAVADAMARDPTARRAGPWMDSVRAWEVGPEWRVLFGPVDGVARMRRLGPESWLVEATASIPGAPPVARARLAWVPDPVTRVLDAQGVVGVGDTAAVVLHGSISTDRLAEIDLPLTPSACPAWSARSRPPEPPPVALYRLPPGVAPALGPMALEDLVAALEPRLARVVTPTPVDRGGSCDRVDPANWGDPDRPAGPCGRHAVLGAYGGTLLMDGGVGQGVLVVDGDLVLGVGARFFGVALVRGVLRVEDDAVLVGMVQAGGGVSVAARGTISGSACRVVRAVEALRELPGVSLLSPEPVGPG